MRTPSSFAQALEEAWGLQAAIDGLRGHMHRLTGALDSVGEEGGDSGGEDVIVGGAGEDEEGPTFPSTCMVVQLSPCIKPQAVEFLIRKICASREEGGAELLVRREPIPSDSKEGLRLHVAASRLKLLEAAEALQLRKRDKQGCLREFRSCDLDNFLNPEAEAGVVDTLLTSAERHLIAEHEMDSMRLEAYEKHIPGYSSLDVYEGQPLLSLMTSAGLVERTFPLHEEKALKRFSTRWYWALFQAQPLEEIRDYFGEAVALYFAFLGHYTAALVVPSILGAFFWLLAPEWPLLLPAACAFNLVWATLFLEMWKRHCNELAFAWGTLTLSRWEEPRPGYRGPRSADPVTNRLTPQYAGWKTGLKAYGVSLPILLFLLYVTFRAMLLFLEWEMALAERSQRGEGPLGGGVLGGALGGVLSALPTAAYAGFVMAANKAYTRLALSLTEWENHRTPTKFERHRVAKLVAFEFLNTFMSLFYIAFYLQDLEQLRSQLLTMLLVQASVYQFQEALLPCVLKDAMSKAEIWWHTVSGRPQSKPTAEPPKSDLQNRDRVIALEKLAIQELSTDDPRIAQARTESQREPYLDTYDDYLELFLQFGYVFLFSAAFPLASLWALLNNVMEIRADAFKLCALLQRPAAKRVRDIGAWQTAFEAVGYLSVATNAALLFVWSPLRAQSKMYNWTDAQWLLMFLLLEHALLGLKAALHHLIPDVPKQVADALKRHEFLARQALSREQTAKSRRHLSRRFKSVYVAHRAVSGKAKSHSLEDGEGLRQRFT